MCKYSYLSGACANRRVESLHCVGEDECEFSDMNILVQTANDPARGSSESAKWLALYCRIHGKYLCGKGDACDGHSSDRRPRGPGRAFQSKFCSGEEGW